MFGYCSLWDFLQCLLGTFVFFSLSNSETGSIYFVIFSFFPHVFPYFFCFTCSCCWFISKIFQVFLVGQNRRDDFSWVMCTMGIISGLKFQPPPSYIGVPGWEVWVYLVVGRATGWWCDRCAFGQRREKGTWWGINCFPLQVFVRPTAVPIIRDQYFK